MKQHPKTPLAAPDAKTPPLDAAASPQRGDVGKDAAETGDSFSYAGHAVVHVTPCGRSKFIPAPAPGTEKTGD